MNKNTKYINDLIINLLEKGYTRELISKKLGLPIKRVEQGFDFWIFGG
jgi:hypothetical protein